GKFAYVLAQLGYALWRSTLGKGSRTHQTAITAHPFLMATRALHQTLMHLAIIDTAPDILGSENSGALINIGTVIALLTGRLFHALQPLEAVFSGEAGRQQQGSQSRPPQHVLQS